MIEFAQLMLMFAASILGADSDLQQKLVDYAQNGIPQAQVVTEVTQVNEPVNYAQWKLQGTVNITCPNNQDCKNAYVTFIQQFEKGAIPEGKSVTFSCCSGVNMGKIAVEPRARYDDGSLQEALITTQVKGEGTLDIISN